MAAEKAEKKNKKIAHMTVQEIEKKIADARDAMGGNAAQYLTHLLKRKATLNA